MSSNTKSTILLLSIGFFIPALIAAQNRITTNLSLNEALEKMKANNHQIKAAHFDFIAAHSDIDQMQSLYLPQIEATATGSVNNLPLHAFGNRLQQGAIEQADFLPEKLNSPSAITNLQTQFMVRQPILNLDGRAMKDAAIAKKNALEQQSLRTQKVLRHQVIQTYLQLQLTYEMEAVLLQAKSTAEANLKLTRDNLEAGYVQLADVLAVELRINELDHQLLETEQNIQNASDQLSFLMGESLGTQYQPVGTLTEQDNSPILLAKAPTDRSDLLAMQHQISAQKHQLTALQKANVPRLNAFGYYELNNNLDFQDAQHGYLIGIQASWRIFNGNKDKSAIQKAQIELEKHQTALNQLMAKNDLELKVAKRKMEEAQNKINLTKKAIAQAEEVLRIKTNRYEEGLEKTTDVLIAETKVAQMQMNYKEALYLYQKAYADILFSLEQN